MELDVGSTVLLRLEAGADEAVGAKAVVSKGARARGEQLVKVELGKKEKNRNVEEKKFRKKAKESSDVR